MKVQRKVLTWDAVQWFRAGDHPAVTAVTGERAQTAGANAGLVPIDKTNPDAGNYLVRPGYWILASDTGYITVDPKTFEEVYEPVPSTPGVKGA